MNFAAIFKAIGRAFTLPQKTRQELDSNPIVQAAVSLAAPAVTQAVADAISANVKDPTAAAVLNEAATAALSHVFPSS